MAYRLSMGFKVIQRFENNLQFMITKLATNAVRVQKFHSGCQKSGLIGCKLYILDLYKLSLYVAT